MNLSLFYVIVKWLIEYFITDNASDFCDKYSIKHLTHLKHVPIVTLEKNANTTAKLSKYKMPPLNRTNAPKCFNQFKVFEGKPLFI